MPRLWIVIGMVLCATTAHAGDLDDYYAAWKQLHDPDAGAIRFSDGVKFLNEHPGWPDEKIIRLRTEQAALNDKPGKDAMSKFCTENPPISGRGMIACAAAGVGDAKTQQAWITQGWIQGDFTEDEENRIYDSYHTKLTRADNINRAERLLYEGKSSGAKRMIPLVPADKQRLYKVRLAFIAGDKHAPHELAKLSKQEQSDTGILFERLRWRIKRGDEDLAPMIISVPKNAPYPDLWWPMRANAARDAIAKGNHTLALTVLANHGDIKGEALADALFMKGWIHLEYKGDSRSAYKEFFQLYNSVYTPVSKARAAYWAGRAAEKNGNKDIATQWMTKAARYPTVFYGQMAHVWLKPKAPLALPAVRMPTDAERKLFEGDEMVRMIKALNNAGDEKTRDQFISALAQRATNETQFAVIAEFATEIGGTASGVEVAKLALRNNVVLIGAGWPKIGLPQGLPLEDALTLAITRQESEFDPEARSPADARGLMQLLPSTAKHIAKRIDFDYKESQLTNPATNLTLGSNYLGQIIDGFDGSYILGIASYNAGPGSVRKWIAARGMPPKNPEGAIDWIESIPFGETRNYVMRVLENVTVYRALAKPEAPVGIEKDLTR